MEKDFILRRNIKKMKEKCYTNTMISAILNLEKLIVSHIIIKGVELYLNSIYAKMFNQGNLNWSIQHNKNLEYLRNQQEYCNNILNENGYIFLNDVYEILGFKKTQIGQFVGWIKTEKGDNFIDFEITEDEGNTIIDFNIDGIIYDKI